jgi:hypothetical protein
MYTTYGVNDEGWVTGGSTLSMGLNIDWQDGPLPQNGATVEDVISAAIERLEAFQANEKSKNAYNAQALVYLYNGLTALHERTRDRQHRGVEGKYLP